MINRDLGSIVPMQSFRSPRGEFGVQLLDQICVVSQNSAPTDRALFGELTSVAVQKKPSLSKAVEVRSSRFQ